MEKLLHLVLTLIVLLAACGTPEPQQEAEEETATEEVTESKLTSFGNEIDEAGAVTVSDMLVAMGENSSIETKIKSEVLAVCQNKGCWMTIPQEKGKEIRVRFKDYGFFVPKDIAGRTVIINGKAFLDTVTVEDLQHYASDEGLPEEEIQAITEPEITIGFEADGVLLLPEKS